MQDSGAGVRDGGAMRRQTAFKRKKFMVTQADKNSVKVWQGSGESTDSRVCSRALKPGGL